MNYKNYIKTILKYLVIILIYSIIISILYYTELINYKTLRIINYIINILLFSLTGYKIASLERKKGYLQGFLISLILILIFIIISLITCKINFSTLVYYLSLISSGVTGGIIGVSKK